MKKIRLHCATLFLLPMLACGVKAEGIKEITKPYLGTYRAEQLYWGGDNVLPFVRDLKVELTDKKEVLVTYKQGFCTQTIAWSYKIDESGELWVADNAEAETWQKVRLEKGKLIAAIPIGHKTLHAVLSR